MRSIEEQVEGLEKVRRPVWFKLHVPLTIVIRLGDVVALPLPDGSELVYASGDYDRWGVGEEGLSETDLPLEKAVEVAVASCEGLVGASNGGGDHD